MGGHVARTDCAPAGERHSLRLQGRTGHSDERRAPANHPDAAVSSVGVVVGNPKPRSRTLAVAEAVAGAAAGAAGLAGAERTIVDLADLGPHLFDWSSADVRVAVDAIRSSTLAVVAS